MGGRLAYRLEVGLALAALEGLASEDLILLRRAQRSLLHSPDISSRLISRAVSREWSD